MYENGTLSQNLTLGYPRSTPIILTMCKFIFTVTWSVFAAVPGVFEDIFVQKGHLLPKMLFFSENTHHIVLGHQTQFFLHKKLRTLTGQKINTRLEIYDA